MQNRTNEAESLAGAFNADQNPLLHARFDYVEKSKDLLVNLFGYDERVLIFVEAHGGRVNYKMEFVNMNGDAKLDAFTITIMLTPHAYVHLRRDALTIGIAPAESYPATARINNVKEHHYKRLSYRISACMAGFEKEIVNWHGNQKNSEVEATPAGSEERLSVSS